MLHSAFMFWQTYLEKPSLEDISAQFPFIEIKAEPDESSQPVAIFLPCYSQTDNKDDIDTTMTTADDNQTINVSDFEPQQYGKIKTHLKKARSVINDKSGFCEICFKGTVNLTISIQDLQQMYGFRF